MKVHRNILGYKPDEYAVQHIQSYAKTNMYYARRVLQSENEPS